MSSTGDLRVAQVGGAAVLLDPHFVDTPVGQDLYLADKIPWKLGDPALPNGEANPASKSFQRANEKHLADEGRRTERIVDILNQIKPIGVTKADEMSAMLDALDSKYAS
jgi:hypothetical protein